MTTCSSSTSNLKDQMDNDNISENDVLTPFYNSDMKEKKLYDCL